MRSRSIRLAIVASLAYLVLWIGSSLVLYLAFLAGNDEVIAVLARGTWVLFVPALGFVGLMIFGMAQQFIPLYAGRDLWSPRLALLQVSLGIAGVALLLPSPDFELVGFSVWLASAVLFVFLLVMTLRSKQLAVRPAGRHPEYLRMDRLGVPMTIAAVLYLIAASAGFVLESPSSRPLVPFALADYYSWLHLYTLGFILLMIFGVGFHLLPRFLDTVPNLRLAMVVVAMALPGPALVAATMPFLDSPSAEIVFAASALFEATAAVLFAALVLDVWRRSEHRRPASAFNAGGVLWLILGVAFGSLFGIAPSLAATDWVPAHGWINLFGFAGFEIFGVTHEVLPPFASLGLKASRRVTRIDLAMASVGLAIVVAALGETVYGPETLGDSLAVLGLAVLLVMAVLYASGVLWSLFGVERRSLWK